MIVLHSLLLLLNLKLLLANNHLVPIPRIVGGKELGVAQCPHHAAYFVRYKSIYLKYQCGGSILTHDWVLSAAHCVDPEARVQGAILVGTLSKTLTGVEPIDIKRTVIHMNYAYSDNENKYDFVLFRLEIPLTFNKSVRPIQLPMPHAQVPDGSKVFVAGFGRLSELGESSDKLMGVQLIKIGQEECKKTIRSISKVHICAIGENGEDSCFGDSGGGLVYNNTLFGVVSFGRGCGRPGMPGVYAAVAEVTEWIEGIIYFRVN